MNLLKDPWIPVGESNDAGIKLITYSELLCENGGIKLALPRDDMEMACLQLLISLTQVIFTPRNKNELFKRIDTPLSEDEYQDGIVPFIEWFDLAHKDWPFMQVRGVEAKDTTAIQKLFGLPEGDGTHTFFNDAAEIRSIGLPAAAIALFNQASCSPNFGGGFKGGLRGVPVTTLVRSETKSRDDVVPSAGRLRRLAWWNVLYFAKLKKLHTALDDMTFDDWQSKRLENDQPTWVKPIVYGEQINGSDIGVLRALFWQPAHVELIVAGEEGFCDFLQMPAEVIVSAFAKAKFNYNVHGLANHPHSAKYLDIDEKKNEMRQGYRSFNKTAPAWTQLSDFLFTQQQPNKKGGNERAAVIDQFGELSSMRLELALGGYINKQASITERRHELVQIGAGWQDGEQAISELTSLASDCHDILRNKAFAFGKMAGGDALSRGLASTASDLFYQQSEPLIHDALRHDIAAKRWRDHRRKLAEELSGLCTSIFEQLTAPYRHKPKMMIALAKSCASLKRDLRRLCAGEQSVGGRTKETQS